MELRQRNKPAGRERVLFRGRGTEAQSGGILHTPLKGFVVVPQPSAFHRTPHSLVRPGVLDGAVGRSGGGHAHEDAARHVAVVQR